MSILGFTYLREKETGEVKEINFTDSKYINIEEATLRTIFKRFFKCLYFYLFRKQTFERAELYHVIQTNAEDIYEEHNKMLSQNELPIINYKEIFQDEKEDAKTTNYIM